RGIQERSDVLVYTSEPVSAAIEVVGNVVVNLEAASDAKDTDFTAILSDLGPDGRALQLGPRIAIRRARYRNGLSNEQLLVPGAARTSRVGLFAAPCGFPRADRSRFDREAGGRPYQTPNDDPGKPAAPDGSGRVADKSLLRGHPRASSVVRRVLRPATP